VHNHNKDGAMPFTRNASGNPDAYYEPNSFNDTPGRIRP
jgi:catalase